MQSQNGIARLLILMLSALSCMMLLSACASKQTPCPQCRCPELPPVPKTLLATEASDLSKFRAEVLSYVKRLQAYSNELNELQQKARLVQTPLQQSSQPEQASSSVSVGKIEYEDMVCYPLK